MATRHINKVLLASCLLAVTLTASAAIISRVHTFRDGDVLPASDLNTEFNNVVNGVNSINDANIVSSAGILPSKISGVIAGDGLARDPSTGALSLNVDTMFGLSSDVLTINPHTLTGTMLNANVADGVSIALGTASNTLAVTTAGISGFNLNTNVADGVYIALTSQRLTIPDAAITDAKRAGLNFAISSSSGIQTTTSSTYQEAGISVTVTNLGTTRPVVVELVPVDGGGEGFVGATGSGTFGGADFQIVRQTSGIDGAFWVSKVQGQPSVEAPCGAVRAFDVVGPGAHSYRLQFKQTSGSTTALLSNCRIEAYSL